MSGANGGELEPSLGAVMVDGGVRFRVWAPASRLVELVLQGTDKTLPLRREGNGYHSLHVEDAVAGDLYRYRLDGGPPFPDPASRFQPQGVHGASQVVDPGSYRWRNSRPSRRLRDAVIYELHVGTFTSEGTYLAAARRLPYLAELGVTTLELMPLGDFPGNRNWGYDPGAMFAPSRAYGTPDELRRLIDEAHGQGLQVILDVVYNHFGPDGAYLPAYSPGVLTDRHQTPWGNALDFDGAHSGGLRRHCLENAMMWLREFELDGLRLDATFAIIDESPTHLLSELARAAARLSGPPRLLIAEDPRNLRNIVMKVEEGGLGLGAVWADDFHHQLRRRLAGDSQGYYRDFGGASRDIVRTLLGNWFYSGQHSLNEGRPRGTPAGDLPPERFVYCLENHDQVGNRPDGSRLNHHLDAAEYRAASALLLFLPQTPMLFMGQEWAASSPFQYFTDHEGELGRLVSEGRRREFAEFDFGETVPDPQDPTTFLRSRLDWSEAERQPHAAVLRLYRDLLALRGSLGGEFRSREVTAEGMVLQRGRHLLLLALECGATLILPPSARPLWSSEDSGYVGDPVPPREVAGRMRFDRAGAVILES